MNANEKRLLKIALIMFIGYMLPFQLAPVAIEFYHDYRDSIANLSQNIELYKKLGERAEYWEIENKKAKQELEKIKSGVLPGTSYELIRTKMQSLVRQLASSSGITFKSLVIPDSVHINEWILVTQSMQFEANSATLIKFLTTIDESKVNLAVVNLDVRSYKNKLTGTIKITGFSQVLEEDEQPL
ncbi:MAG: hypothetical protein KAG43_08860 [Candidatus Marithrix sp.]|nr:hypothetical protein [Candidatus Marithrix sp.]